VNEQRLRDLLRDQPLPAAEEAERRGLAMLRGAFEQRQPTRGRSRPARLAVALAAATLLAALLLSPAGASVRHWVGDVFSDNVPRAHPGLAAIPGGGRLLVGAADGPWVVQPDGSRRLLGDYGEASWSPRGLFVAVASGRTLSAVEPDGTPHWSLTAPAPVRDPRWSPSGFRIAYRAGSQLRVTAADGSGDRLIDPRVAPLAAAWNPLGLSQLAYVSAAGELRIADTEGSARTVAERAALPGVERLEWAGEDASTLLEASDRGLRVRRLRLQKVLVRTTVTAGRELALPAGARVRDAALSPDGRSVAAVVLTRGHGADRSAVVLFDPRGGGSRRLLLTPGRLSEIAFSPDGRRLLVAWPEADEWLFLPIGAGRGRAISGVGAAFAPGEPGAPLPRIDGWCCRKNAPAGGRE
jgi:WD40-like Beta Propeller Repeat